MKIILGNIAFPKSKSLIIPANTVGSMGSRVPKLIVKDGWKGIAEEAKNNASFNKPKEGDVFSTGSGRLKRRGVDRIYHAVIKRFDSDYTSIFIVRTALTNALTQAVLDNFPSVTICGLGIEQGDLDKKTVAMTTIDICKEFKNELKIKIVDDNKEFIQEVHNVLAGNKR